MKITIFFFSPTGGTEQVARLIGRELGSEPIDITVFNCDMSFEEDDLLFFCFPVYGGRIPKPLYDRMAGLHGSGTKAVLIAVYGNRAVEDALSEMQDLCKAQGFATVAGGSMIATHSVDRRFAEGRPDILDEGKLRRFLQSLLAKEEYREITLPGSHGSYKKYDGIPIRPYGGKDCTGCGTCSQECPTGALDPEKPQRPDTKKCISCMRCMVMCPFEVRKIPAAMRLAAAAALAGPCAERKHPEFYLE